MNDTEQPAATVQQPTSERDTNSATTCDMQNREEAHRHNSGRSSTADSEQCSSDTRPQCAHCGRAGLAQYKWHTINDERVLLCDECRQRRNRYRRRYDRNVRGIRRRQP